MLTQQFKKLPGAMWRDVALSPSQAPSMIMLNASFAETIGLRPEGLGSPEGLAMLSGSEMPQGVTPVAQAYAGHQFGQFVPSLGDGRAMLLGTSRGVDGTLFDVQLKGSGRTPFSRGGDGRAAIGPILREYLVSEAMHVLGVPTTRALAAVRTGDVVLRERALPGAIITRVARSFLRVGSFQYPACRGDGKTVDALLDHAITRLFPDLQETFDENKTPDPTRLKVAFMERVARGQARLVAQWMSLGFIHGVMNTDNMAISGETIDYGPCAFLDAYIPDKVFSAIDTRGRYAYARQPEIARWNLMRLAESLLTGPDDPCLPGLREILEEFPVWYLEQYHQLMSQKLGLIGTHVQDGMLIQSFLDALAVSKADYTQGFHQLPAYLQALDGPHPQQAAPGLKDWARNWHARMAGSARELDAAFALMKAHNPAVIPRNHQIEKAIAAAEDGDLTVFYAMLPIVTQPFKENADHMSPPSAAEEVHTTYCGT